MIDSSKCAYCANQATIQDAYDVKVCQQCYSDIEFNKTAPIKYYYILVDKDEVLIAHQIFFNAIQARHYADTIHPDVSLEVTKILL